MTENSNKNTTQTITYPTSMADIHQQTAHPTLVPQCVKTLLGTLKVQKTDPPTTTNPQNDTQSRINNTSTTTLNPTLPPPLSTSATTIQSPQKCYP